MKRSKINAMEMTRRIRDAHYEQLKEKSWEEQVVFYQAQARRLQEELKNLKAEERKALA